MNDNLLDLIRTILTDVRIKSHIIYAPFEWNHEYDGGLRKAILSSSQKEDSANMYGYSIFQQRMESINQQKSITSMRDDFNCEYICMALPNGTQPANLLIGPFTYETLTVPRISELCDLAKVPRNLTDFMQQFYASVPYVSDERWLKSMVRQMAAYLYGENENIPIIRDRIELSSFYDKLYTSEVPEPDAETITMLEHRYENEEKLMNMISVGDYEAIEQFVQEDQLPKPNQRFPDTVRDTKNSMIILNTLCRKAAQAGHVHPVYLDSISKRFATKIENCNSVIKLDAMTREMFRKYCILVQKHSLKNYSPPIRYVINEISFHLDSDLTLDTLADQAGLNKSYLSSLFKKETGETLTSYVNTRRIDHSIYLLNTTKLGIHDIAALCGINDLNYFTKLFKKMKNMTPSEYRSLIHQ